MNNFSVCNQNGWLIRWWQWTHSEQTLWLVSLFFCIRCSFPENVLTSEGGTPFAWWNSCCMLDVRLLQWRTLSFLYLDPLSCSNCSYVYRQKCLFGSQSWHPEPKLSVSFHGPKLQTSIFPTECYRWIKILNLRVVWCWEEFIFVIDGLCPSGPPWPASTEI